VDPFEAIIGTSRAAQAIRDFAARAATVDAPVLLTGESGTGKSLVARAIHAASRRARAPLVAVNCASVPASLFESEFFGHARGAFTGAHQPHRGLFEQAHNGSLFLDEIAELPTALQAKLLTALEDGEIRRVGAERTARVDVRLIAATNANLQYAVRAGDFRPDLYHRLVVLAFRLPPLRERGDDIDLFLHSFLDLFARRHQRPAAGFDTAAHVRLRSHPWPGNVRQLANAVEAAVLACDGSRIAPRHLPRILLDEDILAATPPSALDTPPASGEAARNGGRRYSFYGSTRDELRHIQDVLRRCRGNRTRAAAELGMSRNTLRAKLRGWAADPTCYGPDDDTDENCADADGSPIPAAARNGAD
jgi:two-component system, NtrC family, response regulator AtoC